MMLEMSSQDYLNTKLLSIELEIPELKIEQRYKTHNNFTGSPVLGYENLPALARPELVERLKLAAQEFKQNGYSLIIYDAYRPIESVEYFVKWAESPVESPHLKTRFYPNLRKFQLLEEGYLSRASVHSKGLAIDVGLVVHDIPLDMGTEFDFFDQKSHTDCPDITADQRTNRQKLKTGLEKFGFKNYSKEWWHFSLKL